MNEILSEIELYAWLGRDDGFPVEGRTPEIGLKQARTPAGFIPLVATTQAKMDRPELFAAMQQMADTTGTRRVLVRFVFAGIVATVDPDAGRSSVIPIEVMVEGDLGLP